MIFQIWQVKPIGDWSLAGAQLKLMVREVLRLDCARCDWFILGHREGDQAVFPDPHVADERGIEPITGKDAGMLLGEPAPLVKLVDVGQIEP